MTRFARARTLCGIATPICLAVLKLITNSYLVGCSTGKIGRFRTFQDLIYIRGGAAKCVEIVG